MELAELTHFLRTELPRVLRDHPEVRHEVWGIMLEAFPSRQEFAQILAELRAFREDTNRRFEELREDMTRRFEAAIAELRSQRLHLSRLSGRLGYGLEYLARGVVEEFAGKTLTRSERLVLRDPEGEVFGVSADIEFDLLACDGEAYLCEVKSHIEPEDVLRFHRKALVAAKHIGRPFVRVMIGATMEAAAETLMKSLGIRSIARARIEPDDSVVSLL